MTQRRIVSISLPHFAMERWQRVMERQGNAPSDDVPTVLVRQAQHGPVIHATNRAARLSGVTAGARVVDMRAICPELQVEFADPMGDRTALDRLALWARRWCPWTVRDGDNGLILETTGADHLWGGEAAMLIEMETRLSLLGLSAQLAVAPTWGAAWALARYGPVRAICGPDEVAQQLAPLSVAGLRLTQETLTLLRRLGLKTIGALQDVPRLSLTRRFIRAQRAANPLIRLDQAFGKTAEPVASQDAPPRFRAQSRLAEPIFDPSPYIPALCEELCRSLAQAGRGCRRLHLTIYRTDGDVSQIQVATSVLTRDANHLLGLFQDRVEKINPGFGFDLITLDAAQIEDITERQISLDRKSDEAELDLTRLVDRLSAKFGPRTVTRPVLRASHIPERAQTRVEALTAPNIDHAPAAPERPVRLFDPPEEVKVLYAVPEGPPAQFIWRRQTHRVARYAGPERIAPEWWSDRPGTRLRDYFKVEDQDGRRLWLYREGLHGDGRGGDPHWFVHGAFA